MISASITPSMLKHIFVIVLCLIFYSGLERFVIFLLRNIVFVLFCFDYGFYNNDAFQRLNIILSFIYYMSTDYRLELSDRLVYRNDLVGGCVDLH